MTVSEWKTALYEFAGNITGESVKSLFSFFVRDSQ